MSVWRWIQAPYAGCYHPNARQNHISQDILKNYNKIKVLGNDINISQITVTVKLGADSNTVQHSVESQLQNKWMCRGRKTFGPSRLSADSLLVLFTQCVPRNVCRASVCYYVILSKKKKFFFVVCPTINWYAAKNITTFQDTVKYSFSSTTFTFTPTLVNTSPSSPTTPTYSSP